jgi:hypothetical protein
MSTLRDVDWARQRLGQRNRDAIYHWVHKDLVPHVRIGRRVYFDEVELEAFIRSGGCRTLQRATTTRAVEA